MATLSLYKQVHTGFRHPIQHAAASNVPMSAPTGHTWSYGGPIYKWPYVMSKWLLSNPISVELLECPRKLVKGYSKWIILPPIYPIDK